MATRPAPTLDDLRSLYRAAITTDELPQPLGLAAAFAVLVLPDPDDLKRMRAGDVDMAAGTWTPHRPASPAGPPVILAPPAVGIIGKALRPRPRPDTALFRRKGRRSLTDADLRMMDLFFAARLQQDIRDPALRVAMEDFRRARTRILTDAGICGTAAGTSREAAMVYAAHVSCGPFDDPVARADYWLWPAGVGA
jgi:hypothetical protein